MTTESRRLLGGRFVLESRIGAGNYAEIYRATDTQTGNPVAVKTLRSEHATQEQAISLFEKEGEVGSAITHENIVRIWSHGVENDVHYIVMELVSGVSLRRWLTLRGRISIAESLRIMRAVLLGLEAIHDAGYVHRDIKPQNILLDASGTAKITDFGIAIGPGEPRPDAPGLTLGTAAYIAPEQAAGEETGPQADVYSAGAVLFEMLTGEPPFPGNDPVVVMNQHLFEPPRDPRSLNPEISPALAALVIRALAKGPTARFASASRMRQSLELLETDPGQPLKVRRIAPTVSMAWTAPLGPPKRLPAKVFGMPALTTFVSALLLVILIIVLMLALVSSLATADGSPDRISNSGEPSGVTSGSTQNGDLRPSNGGRAIDARSAPRWFVSAAVVDVSQTSQVAASSPASTTVPPENPLVASSVAPVPSSQAASPPASTPATTPRSTPNANVVYVAQVGIPAITIAGSQSPSEQKPVELKSQDSKGQKSTTPKKPRKPGATQNSILSQATLEPPAQDTLDGHDGGVNGVERTNDRRWHH